MADDRAIVSVGLFLGFALALLGGSVGAGLALLGVRFYNRARDFLARSERTLHDTTATQAHAARVSARLIAGAAEARRARRRHGKP